MSDAINKGIIKEGQFVVMVRAYDIGNNKIVPVSKDTIVHFGKLHFYTNNLIGYRYGTVFKMIEQKLEPIDDFDEFNVKLYDQMTTNLATFDRKSQFSQEKIIKKKKKQNHANILTVIEPTLELLHEVLYTRSKLGGFRIDLLSQVLSAANIQNGSKCLLLDHSLGILTAAILSRSLPDGKLVQVMSSIELVHNSRNSLNMINIDENAYRGHLFAISFADVFKIHQGTDNFEEEERLLSEKNRKKKCNVLTQARSPKKSVDETDSKQLYLIKRDLRRQNKYSERGQATVLLKSKSFDSLIIYVQNEEPLRLLEIFLTFLAPSKPFVLYSDTVELLIECYQYLKSSRLAIMLNLSESWLRTYQILPDRCRPEMNSTGYGGYVLSGIKVTMENSRTNPIYNCSEP